MHRAIPPHAACLALVSLLGSLQLLHAANWPEFRGSRQGHAPEASPPLTWSPEENIRWKTPIPGKAWSSPIAVGDAAYITTAVETDDRISLRAMALDLEEGAIRWDTEIFLRDASYTHQKNSHASPTPIYEDGRLYAHFGHLGTACLDATTGEVIWTQESLGYSPVHGNGSSPIIVGPRLIYSADGETDPSLIALNKLDGTVSWVTRREVDVRRPFSFCTPLFIEAAGRGQVISPCSGAVISYDPETGEEIWRARYGEGFSVTPRPVFAHGMIYASSGFMRAIAYAIRPDGTGDVTGSHIAWTYDKTVPRESSFIVVGDEFYMNDDKGVLTCLDARTGEVHYVERMNPEGGYSASPVYAGGHLYFINGEGITTVIRPGKTYTRVAENSIGEYGLSSFAVLGDGFLHRTEDHLIRIGP